MTSRPRIQFGARSLAALLVLTLLIAFVAGRLSVAGPAARAQEAPAGADATATREAELDELSELRTQVASTPPALVCTPAATSTPEPSPTATPSPTVVPPVQSGVPVTYDEVWTVTVTGVTLQPTYDRFTAEGVFANVTFTIVNNTGDAIRFPYQDLKLRDAQGRVYLPDRSVGFELGSNWIERVSPSLPVDRFLVFDIAADAEGPFILESETDPTFRVEVEEEIRG